ncbi:SDR family oxidoreductase [Nitrospinaceae bacterium]|nr:SDR family oxidoreductase [Nitrospinaceae bacterium]
MIRLENEIAIVTGASRGIGADIAEMLASVGCRVVINYLQNFEKGEALISKIREAGGTALAIQADVTRHDDAQKMLDRTIEEFGVPTILVNNVGPGIISKKLIKTDWADFETCINTGVKSAFNCSKIIGPLMMKNRKGHIINISSQYSFGIPPVAMSTYVTAKYALVGLSKCLAIELAPFGVNVNIISPGMTETDLVGHLPEGYKQAISEGTPLKRNTKCSDVSNAVLFLVSSPSSFITGINLPVCGGNVM